MTTELENDFNIDVENKKYGDITIQQALKLLDLINEFLGETHNVSQLDNIIMDVSEPIVKRNVMMESETLGSVLSKIKIKIPNLNSHIDIAKIATLVKTHIIKDNTFRIELMQKTVDETMIRHKIEENSKYVEHLKQIVRNVLRVIKTMEYGNKIDFSQINVIHSKCNEQNVMCYVDRQKFDIDTHIKRNNEILKQLNDLKGNPIKQREIIENHKKVQKKIADTFKTFGVNNIDELKALIENSKTHKDVILYFRKIGIKKISLRDVEENIKNVYEIFKIYNPHFKETTIGKMITDIVQFGLNMEKKVGHLDYPTKLIEDVNKIMSDYSEFVKKNPKVPQSYRDVLTKYKKYENMTISKLSKMNVYDIVEYVQTFISVKIGVSSNLLRDLDDTILMCIWQLFNLKDLQMIYDILKRIDPKILRIIEHIPVDELFSNIDHIKILKDIIELVKQFTDDEKIFQIISENKIETVITDITKENETLKSQYTTYESKKDIFVRDIDMELGRLNNIFAEALNITQMLDKFSKDDEKKYDKFKTTYDTVNMKMYGGVNQTADDFLKLIKINMTQSNNTNNLLLEYGRVVSELKSTYTLLYNNIQKYHIMLMDFILYNIFKIIVERDVCKDILKIPRFISYDYLTKIQIAINQYDDEIKRKYKILITKMDILTPFLSNEIMKYEGECIDVEMTKNIDIILIIALYERYKSK